MRVGGIHPKATHLVAGYSLEGAKLLETWHIGESSAQAEVAAWRSRMAKGEVGWVTIQDLKKLAAPQTIYR